MNSVLQKRCVCGGLIVGIFVGGTFVEVCERSVGASACPAPRIEWNHDHRREPQGPSFTHQPYVLGTGTDTRGNMQGFGASTTAGSAALTLDDAQGNDVTELHRA